MVKNNKKISWLKVFNFISSTIVAGVIGVGLNYIIYDLNQPLGLKYALYTSYILTGLLVILLNIRNINLLKD